MPLTVAPPPWNGDAAQGLRPADAPAFAASDRAAAPDEAPRVEPARPAPAAIGRTVAAGVLLSAGASAFAGLAVLTAATLRLALTNNAGLSFDGVATPLLVAGFALAVAGLLAVPTPLWPAPRPTTLALALVVSAGWPLSGYPFVAGPVAILAAGLALARDRRGDRGRRVRGEWPAGVLIAAASAVLIAGLSAAKPHRSPTPAKVSAHSGPDPHRAPSATNTPGSSTAHDADTAGTLAPPSEEGPVASPTPAAGDSSAAHDADTAGTLAPPSGDAPAATSTPSTDKPASPLPEAPAADTPASPLADEATAFVRDYYKALDERRFDDAWASLSPSVRGAFGGLAHWKSGYARTVSSRPRDLAVRTDGNATVVEHRLLAREKDCASTLNFSVTWRLERVSDTWKVAGLRGTALPGPRC